MSDIEQLLGRMSDRVFDREALLREVLATKVMEWLQARRFYNHELTLLRGIAHDILGLPPVGRREGLAPDIERLDCMSFDNLSPVNLRECVLRALEYVGITEKTGVDLLGVNGWAALQRRVKTLSDVVAQEANTKPVHDDEVTAWSQLALSELLVSLFKGEKYFSICLVDKLVSALNQVRDTRGMPRHEDKGVTRATLNALHCQDYDKMNVAVRAGIKQAVWQVCGLSEDIGPVAFGEHWERVKALDVEPLKKEQSLSPHKLSSRFSPFVLPVVVWAVLTMFMLGIFGYAMSAIGKDKGHLRAATRPWIGESKEGESNEAR